MCHKCNELPKVKVHQPVILVVLAAPAPPPLRVRRHCLENKQLTVGKLKPRKNFKQNRKTIHKLDFVPNQSYQRNK